MAEAIRTTDVPMTPLIRTTVVPITPLINTTRANKWRYQQDGNMDYDTTFLRVGFSSILDKYFAGFEKPGY